jgi:hypothetical protein
VFSETTSSLTTVRTVTSSMNASGDSGTATYGPATRNVLKLLARVRKRGLGSRTSSAVMSMIGTNPATTPAKSSSATLEHRRPKTTPSSASAVTRSVTSASGSRIGPPGPVAVDGGLMKLPGSSGRTSSKSSAWSA